MKFLSNFFLAALLVITSFSYAQRGKNGNVTVNTANRIVNEYTTLTANAAAGATTITVAASGLNANSRFPANLAAGDLIMIIQVQGVSANGSVVEFPAGSGTFYGIPNDITWGEITSYNNCGRYEFAEVRSVPNSTSIQLDCGLRYDYTAAGRVQVIRVPRYNNLTVTAPGSITGHAWATGGIFTGGIVAVEVLGNTVINTAGGINVNALGFRGGSLVGDNATLNGGGQAAMQNNAEGAEKGEGVYGYQADYNPIGGRYCRGAAGNAGGGGNAHNAGGGGGANAGSLSGWDGLGNPDNSNATWAQAWNLDVNNTFSSHTSPGGGRGGYSFSAFNMNALTDPPRPFQSGITNGWGGDYRTNNGGLGGRPLDYTGGRIFMGGGGGAGDQNSSQGGGGGRGAGLVYLMSYGTVSGTGTITANGAAGVNSGTDGAGGGGAGGTVILNSVGVISGISVSANGGNGGNQVIPLFATVQGEGPGGSGSGGYIAVSNGAVAQAVNPGANGTTDASHLTEFIPNGATRGAAGLQNQTITNFTISASGVTICSGNTATLTAAINGTAPAGSGFTWWDAETGGNQVGSGSPWTTPVLNSTTTYWVEACPNGTYRIPVIVTVNPGLVISVNSASVCGTVTTTLTASGGTSYSWSAGATSTGANTATVSPSSTTTYTVTGTTGSCSGTATSTITVSNPSVATFNYPGTPYCSNGADPSPVFTGGGTAGTFASTVGLSLNPTTGVVDLSASTPGTYNVTNTVNGTGTCPNASASTSITITALPNATFGYSGSPFCSNETDPSPVFNGGGTPGTFTSTAGLSINPGSGLVDLSASTAGTYIITNTFNSSGGCPAVTDTGLVVISTPQTGTFSYTANPYCQDAADPSPDLNAGSVAGTFASTAGLSINSSTGVVDLSASTAGTYTITNTLPANGGCPGSVSNTSITINPVQSAAFSYSTLTYCQSGTDPTPAVTGTPSGTFTSSPAGLSINAGSGTIDLSASLLNSYIITYTTPGPCGSSSNINLTITNTPVSTFQYTASPYCQNAADPLPVFTGGGTAGVFSSTAGLVFLNTGTGQVDLSASTAGTYTVTNTIAASGGCSADSSTAQITITTAPTASFSYAASPYCQNGTDPSPTLSAGANAGLFTSTAGLSINSSTGVVDLSASTAGTYMVLNTVSGTCGTADSSAITISTPPDATIIQPASVCASAAPFNLTAATTGGTWAGTGITNTATGLFDPSVGPGSYVIDYVIAGSCGASDQVTVTVTSLLDATITAVAPVCTGAAPFNLSAATSGGLWGGTGITDVVNGTFDPSIGPGNYNVTYTISGSCGNSDSETITVTNAADATITQPAPLCSASPAITLTAATSGGVWSGTGISDAVAGTYDPALFGGIGNDTVTYSISGACAATDTVVISVTATADAGIAPVADVCEGTAAFNMSAATTGGSWSGPGITNSTTGTFDPVSAGTGSHQVKYTISGTCGDIDSVLVNVIPAANADIAPVTAVCEGSPSFNLASAAAGGIWSGNGITNSTLGTFNPAAAGTFTVTYTIAGTCSDTDTETITVNPSPSPDATVDLASGCAPLCIQFTDLSTDCNNISYAFGDGDSSAVSDPSHCYTVPGTYNVIITCTSAAGCAGTNTISSTITVNGNPSAEISASPAGVISTNSPVTFTDVSTNGGNSSWNFGDPLSINNTSLLSADQHTYTSEGTYCITLISTNAQGCVDSVTECIIVAGEVTLVIPNVFTPNGDGSNDAFFITSTGVKTLTCSIYDRWGLKMAELKSVNEKWDGRTTSGGIAVDGVYYYILEVEGINEKKVQKQGFVQLLNK
ncbi:MAG TPA: gliding motility-associated C-terminal domain-containing protein [Bacteroidia bacterium]|jgi:gliding motility-associated-like protein